MKTYNKINRAIWRHFGRQMNKETKLRSHNITAKAALKFGSEAWLLKKREEQHLEGAQMKFLRHLLGITKLDKEKNHCIGQKTGAQNVVREIKQHQVLLCVILTVPGTPLYFSHSPRYSFVLFSQSQVLLVSFSQNAYVILVCKICF